MSNMALPTMIAIVCIGCEVVIYEASWLWGSPFYLNAILKDLTLRICSTARHRVIGVFI